MSKAKIDWQTKMVAQLVQREQVKVNSLLNATDLADTNNLLVYSSYNIHPAPILRDVQMRGQFWQIDQNTYLPADMRYGVEKL